MRKRGRRVTLEDVRFVYENYAHMSVSQICDKIGISKFQVNKIVHELRKRGVQIPKKVGRKVNVYDAFVEELRKQKKI